MRVQFPTLAFPGDEYKGPSFRILNPGLPSSNLGVAAFGVVEPNGSGARLSTENMRVQIPSAPPLQQAIGWTSRSNLL